MPHLVIRRGASNEAGLLRRIKVKVDGNIVAKLKNDDEVSLDLPLGAYDVAAQMDWFHGGPLRIALEDDETVTVLVSLSMTKGWIGFISPSKGIQVEIA